jgi:hypothetical protein
MPVEDVFGVACLVSMGLMLASFWQNDDEGGLT